LAGDEEGALLVEGADPRRPIERQHPLPHLLLGDARKRRRVDDRLLRDVEERDAHVVYGLEAVDGLRVLLVRVVPREADRVDVGNVVLRGEDAAAEEPPRLVTAGERVREAPDGRRRRAVVPGP